MIHRIILLTLLSAVVVSVQAQDYRWQQRVEYTMDVNLDVQSHKITGTQKLVYYNNSPDTLTKVYYHLYFNAFQPGSMMDVRSRTIKDPDARVMERISKLKPDEIGYQHIQYLKQDGANLTFHINQTVMEVTLAKPLLPKSKTTFDLKFEAQVPIQIRRSGRDNKEGIAYSMTQWYPKMAEYDFQGWHAYQYVAREFHGVWGDFDVKLTLDPSYIVGGTGKLVNADQVGYNYEKPGAVVKRPGGNLVWHFVAKDVIDFAWAADPDYTHDRKQVPGGPELHFFYQKNDKTKDTWPKMEDDAVKTFTFLNQHFGRYPFETYSIIQGGDGGMEYPMCTLILGEGTMPGLTNLMAHESTHSWYEMVLASNESLYPWMDEGYTDFASAEAVASFTDVANVHQASYQRYFDLVSSGLQEPLSQPGDHFNTNRAYTVAAYSMGAVFLEQLKYVIGTPAFYKGMLSYYNAWKMHHPEPNDFVRVMEKTSGLQLHWYYRYWVNTTKKIDYGIETLTETDGGTFVTLQRLGEFPMPIDLVVTYTDGSKELYYIAMNEMIGKKGADEPALKRNDLEPWPWVNPSYVAKINRKVSEIQSIEIDPSLRMADINRKNNKLVVADKTTPYTDPTR